MAEWMIVVVALAYLAGWIVCVRLWIAEHPMGGGASEYVWATVMAALWPGFLAVAFLWGVAWCLGRVVGGHQRKGTR